MRGRWNFLTGQGRRTAGEELMENYLANIRAERDAKVDAWYENYLAEKAARRAAIPAPDVMGTVGPVSMSRSSRVPPSIDWEATVPPAVPAAPAATAPLLLAPAKAPPMEDAADWWGSATTPPRVAPSDTTLAADLAAYQVPPPVPLSPRRPAAATTTATAVTAPPMPRVAAATPRLDAATATAAALMDHPATTTLSQLPPTNGGAPMTPGGGGRHPFGTRRHTPGVVRTLLDSTSGIPADLGISNELSRRVNVLGKRTLRAHPMAARAVMGLGQTAALGIKAAPWIAAAAPTVMGAMEGSQFGSGGAVVQGAASGLGAVVGGIAGGMVAGPFGAAVGAGLGGSFGSAAGGAANQAISNAVTMSRGGAGGLVGDIGRAMDPVFDTPEEQESYRLLAQMNSPAAIALKEEERRRTMAQRTQAYNDMYMQALTQGAFG